MQLNGCVVQKYGGKLNPLGRVHQLFTGTTDGIAMPIAENSVVNFGFS